MAFSSVFRLRNRLRYARIASDDQAPQPQIAADSLGSTTPTSEVIRACPSLPEAIRAKNPDFKFERWFLPTQLLWVIDESPLRIWEKSRQVGATKTDAFDSVLKVCYDGAKFDVWVTSRDELQARLYLEDCKEWARILHLAVIDLGVVVLDRKSNTSAHVLEFASGRRIYCLSSNPNAMAGKRGHVKIDEFALHPEQRLLYKIAKPVTQWGGTLSIISTHRGANTLFNQIIGDIRFNGNPMGWQLFTYPIQKAVDEGLVQRINEKSGRNETNEEFLKRIRAECIDEDQWLQEYCCTPADESTAFFSYDLIKSCEDRSIKLMTLAEFLAYASALDPHRFYFYVGIDVATKTNLTVIDVGEKLGDVLWDRLRIELHDCTYREIEHVLFPILKLPHAKRACMDSTGGGGQLFERTKERFGWKAEGVHFSGPVKEDLGFALRAAFEDRKLRIVSDDKLRSDLHALRKEVTAAGNIRLDGDFENSHCDRTWALALRHHAARRRRSAGGLVA